MAASHFHFETGTHHCAIFHSDAHGVTNRGFENCKLHPGHKEFMTVDEFLNKKPSDIGLHKKYMPAIRNVIDSTVKVVVKYTSTDRPDTFINSKCPYPFTEIRGSTIRMRCGTGSLVERYRFDVTEPCPCPDCEESTCQTANLESYYFVLKTATHVIFDEQEAQNSRFEFFYDSENRNEVKKVYGVTVLDSNFLRLETDRCFVVCVTHDSSLAEKLGLLCEKDLYARVDQVLVSHPHGVSKRISVGDRPQTYFRIISNETCLTLKKGMDIRFPGCNDARCVVKVINHFLDKPVIGHKWLSNNFVLLCNLRVYRPEGIVMQTENNGNWGAITTDPRRVKWFDVFPPGTQLVSDDGKIYTFPYNKGSIVRMEVLGNRKYFFDNYDEEKHHMYAYCRYSMASCPGSSGAPVTSHGLFFDSTVTAHVHFGNFGDYNSSSLLCTHAPDDEQRPEIKSKYMGMEVYTYKKYKQLLPKLRQEAFKYRTHR